jgi:hypothetical protein
MPVCYTVKILSPSSYTRKHKTYIGAPRGKLKQWLMHGICYHSKNKKQKNKHKHEEQNKNTKTKNKTKKQRNNLKKQSKNKQTNSLYENI